MAYSSTIFQMQARSLLLLAFTGTSLAIPAPAAIVQAATFNVTGFSFFASERTNSASYSMNITGPAPGAADGYCQLTRAGFAGTNKDCPQAPEIQIPPTTCGYSPSYNWTLNSAPSNDPSVDRYVLQVNFTQETGPVLSGCRLIERSDLYCDTQDAAENNVNEAYIGPSEFGIYLEQGPDGCIYA